MKSKLIEQLKAKGVKCPEALANTCGIWKAGSCSWCKRSTNACKNFRLTVPRLRRKNATYKGKPSKAATQVQKARPIQARREQEAPFVPKPEAVMLGHVTTAKGIATMVVTPQGKLRLTIEATDSTQARQEFSEAIIDRLFCKVPG